MQGINIDTLVGRILDYTLWDNAMLAGVSPAVYAGGWSIIYSLFHSESSALDISPVQLFETPSCSEPVQYLASLNRESIWAYQSISGKRYHLYSADRDECGAETITDSISAVIHRFLLRADKVDAVEQTHAATILSTKSIPSRFYCDIADAGGVIATTPRFSLVLTPRGTSFEFGSVEYGSEEIFASLRRMAIRASAWA